MDKSISRFEYAIREHISAAETKGFRPLTIAEEIQNREDNIRNQMARLKVKNRVTARAIYDVASALPGDCPDYT